MQTSSHIPRQRSPAPPPIPPKDNRSPSTSSSSHRSSQRYVNQDLAEAVRDSVQIGNKSSSSSLNSGQTLSVNNTRPHSTFEPGTVDYSQPRLAKPPSLNPLVPRRTPSPHLPTIHQDHQHSHSSSGMSHAQQPQLPSQRLLSSQNPFESDEIEPPHPVSQRAANDVMASSGQSRAKFTRAHTAHNGLSTSTSISSSANLIQTSPPKTRIRRSMSSGSYGLDANGRELTAGQRKALEDKKGSRHADVIDTWDPTGMGSAMWHHAGPYDAAAPSRNNANLPTNKAPMRAFNGAPPVQAPPRTGQSTISVVSPPEVPKKDDPKRVPRQIPNRRQSGGGLTGQYSTSMPAGGGYFPDMSEPASDEAELARRERQREREQKRRALKAAWGIDEPEPFEAFGMSPGENDTVDLADEMYSPDVSSPSLRHSTIVEEGVIAAPANTGGVKRTKSLMQKIKTMRDSHNKSPMRSSSPRAVGATSPGEALPSPPHDPSIPAPVGRKPGFFSRPSADRSSPQKASFPPALPEEEQSDELAEVDADEKPLPTSTSGYVLVQSPSSKARAMKALQREQRESRREPMEVLEAENDSGFKAHVPGAGQRGNNNLPTPPIAPVIPDFGDLMTTRTVSRGGDDGLKRKTSMVKKFRERMK